VKYIRLVSLFFFIFGCSDESSVIKLHINSLLHDDSSKMWMVEKELIDGKDHAPENINFRTVITFYNDFKFAEQPLNTLGNRPPKYGIFEVGSQNATITFVIDKKENVFIVESYSKQEIILKTEEGRGERIYLQLIPLPKI
jgi:hypothetical protein